MFPIWPVQTVPTKIVYSDASETACASVIDIEGYTFHQNWSEPESLKSSTFEELRTAELKLKSFIREQKSQVVVWFTDNQSVTTIVTLGSKVCVAHGIKSDIQWIPRDLNYVTDELSKIVDFDDYTLHDQVFNYIDTI